MSLYSDKDHSHVISLPRWRRENPSRRRGFSQLSRERNDVAMIFIPFMKLLQDKNAKELCYDNFYTRLKILNSEILLTVFKCLAINTRVELCAFDFPPCLITRYTTSSGPVQVHVRKLQHI